jgi:hypothetical protein
VILKIAAAIAVLCGLAAPVGAQGLPQGQLSGTVRDATGAVMPEVRVTISSPRLIGGPQTTETDQSGTYRFIALPAGVYEVVLSRQGFATVTRTGVPLPADGSLIVDEELPVATIVDRITTVAAPAVDVRSSASPHIIDTSLLHHLPATREIAHLINLSPGVSQNVAFGGTEESNALTVDGVDTTEASLQGAWARYNFNWIEEVKVLALGAGAEYGEFTGVTANSTLRSGTNTVAGLAEYWTTPSTWVADNTAHVTPRSIIDLWDGSAQIGGPLRKDRLWFFGGYQYAFNDDRPAGFSGPGSRAQSDHKAILKLTSSVHPSLRLEGFLQHGRLSVSGDRIGPTVPLEASQDLEQAQTSWNTRSTWVPGSQTLLEIRAGGYAAPQHWGPHPPGTRSGPYPRVDVITGMESVNAQSFADEGRSRQGVEAVYTQLFDRLGAGHHELKAGAEFERSALYGVTGHPGGRLYFDEDGAPSLVSLWEGEIAHAAVNRWTAYVRDQWQAHSRLTVNAGFRLDVNRASIPVHGTVLSTNPFAPRVGMAWDLGARHRTVVRAHYGRYFDTTFANYVLVSDSSQRSASYLAEVVGPDEFVIIDSIVPGEWRSLIDQELRHSYVDQYVLGAQHAVRGLLTLEAQFIHRRFDRFFGISREGSSWTPVQRQDPGIDGVAGTGDDGDLMTVYTRTAAGQPLLVNPDAADRRYSAVQAIARKAYSGRWQMQASYTWSRTSGTVGNQWHANAGHLGFAGDYSNPNTRINADGRMPLDFAHSIKVLGTWTMPWLGGANLSGVLRHDSGFAWERTASFRVPSGRVVVRVEPRGSRRLDPVSVLDVRAEKTFRLGQRGSIGLFVDALNLSNSGTATRVDTLSGPGFGNPVAWIDPRTARAGLRWTF